MKIVHIAYLHAEKDIRILLKECVSLFNKGHRVTYITSSKEGNDIEYSYEGVNIITLATTEKNKLTKQINYSRRVFNLTKIIDADVYHLHEPNLLLLGLKLTKQGKKIIFDAHENYHGYKYGMVNTSSIKTKIKYTVLSFVYWKIIMYTVGKCEGVITAGEDIAVEYNERAKRIVVINNYPLLYDIECDISDYLERDNIFCYVGGVNSKRMIDTILHAFSEMVDVRFLYAGPIAPEFIKTVKADFENSSYLGVVDRQGMNKLYSQSIIGLILLSSEVNHYDIQSNKLFEYMMAGLPVICSNFPKWKEFIQKNKCGIAVNPNDKEAIKKAIEYLAINREEALQMSINGKKAVMEEYNWSQEEEKLIRLYSEIEL